MSEDVRIYIRQCDRCMRFKKPKEQTELFPITATYPLELVHLDFLSIGGKEDKMEKRTGGHRPLYSLCPVLRYEKPNSLNSGKRVSEQIFHHSWVAGQNTY